MIYKLAPPPGTYLLRVWRTVEGVFRRSETSFPMWKGRFVSTKRWFRKRAITCIKRAGFLSNSVFCENLQFSCVFLSNGVGPPVCWSRHFCQITTVFCQILCFFIFPIGRSGRFFVKFCVFVKFPLFPRTFVRRGGFLSNFVFLTFTLFPRIFVKWGRSPRKFICRSSGVG